MAQPLTLYSLTYSNLSLCMGCFRACFLGKKRGSRKSSCPTCILSRSYGYFLVSLRIKSKTLRSGGSTERRARLNQWTRARLKGEKSEPLDLEVSKWKTFGRSNLWFWSIGGPKNSRRSEFDYRLLIRFLSSDFIPHSQSFIKRKRRASLALYLILSIAGEDRSDSWILRSAVGIAKLELASIDNELLVGKIGIWSV